MVVYQIHEAGGEWEDKYDMIVGTYLSERKAEVERQKLEAEEYKRVVRAKKCDDCPLYDSWDPLTNQIIEATKRYCPYYVGVEDRRCSNYEGDMEKKYFYIYEVEVIE